MSIAETLCTSWLVEMVFYVVNLFLRGKKMIVISRSMLCYFFHLSLNFALQVLPRIFLCLYVIDSTSYSLLIFNLDLYYAGPLQGNYI